MWEAILGAVTSLVPTIEGWVGTKSAQETAEKLARQKLEMPSEMIKAEALAREQAYSNMPGYDTYKEQIDQLLPRVAGQAKEVSSSPSAVIGLMSKALGETNKAYQDLAIKNVGYHSSALNNYQDFLTKKAGMGLGIQEGNINTNKEAIYQQAQGTKDLMEGIDRGVGAGINTYAMMKELGYDKEQLDWMRKFFGQGGFNNPNSPAMPSFGSIDYGSNTDSVWGDASAADYGMNLWTK